MKTEIETLAGETPGIAYELVVHRLSGSDAAAPSVYIQAALHADERPGPAALHYLIPELVRAEAEGRLRGSLTLVPQANPVGAAQHMFSQHMGRFYGGNRINFNRDFPIPDAQGVRRLDGATSAVFTDRRLKSRLLELADNHRVVLDLHCDDEGVQYLYIPDRLWPEMADLAACLDAEAAVLWNAGSDCAFEEAAFAQMVANAKGGDLTGHCCTTVELRGQLDVDPVLARKDAQGLYRFLVMRGVITDDAMTAAELRPDFVAEPIAHVEMIKAPVGGTILYHVSPGDQVEAGQLVAEVVTRPGEPGGAAQVHAPQKGFVLTRRSRRFIRMGDDLLKLVADRPSPSARIGALED
ncbi:MAG: succinylglutamate desuccinylase/aspartoacylase family protein [Hoeflea sp.]|uniref:succinylglutamate desuccinylase/aspartoacylase domain-containing protein n=1 Tax=Hoeflea sp. TaxID=1940281 RepID=UPI001D983C15|nr:succinylglutamate desuccinylase/aspartoacylase family protein [Hoeflea sp.]MBU4531677.1 succinylglutamate desuccinylase/aspartoacylase family protein [Alphaproteobacteria bacterium]MBU4544534.1 succinylglutamate desuccinylase/aspartoacylase family protein [Alphaproteobacteria bacterium]MBU4552765.1 succinylglutamate desuccinylase/aspartoacylase family protein [Alphaproteobacteria bacterium]MBV1724953.1 succinylglutamate desuccinylase/aspartoacylase family protein [Hoeflea sp.]MBV1760973.1 s